MSICPSARPPTINTAASGPATASSERAWSAWMRGPAERIWHFQMAHHGVWDYDLPAAPNLVDIRVNGEPVKAVAQ